MIDVITIEDTPEPSRAPPPAQGTSASAYASTSRSYGPTHPEPALKKRKSDGSSDQNGYHDNQSHGNGYRSALPSGSHASTSNGGYASANGQANGSRATASSKNKRKHDAYDGYSNGRDSVSSRDVRLPSFNPRPTPPLTRCIFSVRTTAIAARQGEGAPRERQGGTFHSASRRLDWRKM